MIEYRVQPYQCTVLPSLMQLGFTLIRGWPLLLGRSRVTYSRGEVGTISEEAFWYNCTQG